MDMQIRKGDSTQKTLTVDATRPRACDLDVHSLQAGAAETTGITACREIDNALAYGRGRPLLILARSGAGGTLDC